jgi:hypothetical protein
MKTFPEYSHLKKYEIKKLGMGPLQVKGRAVQMIGTNERTNRVTVVVGPSFGEWLVRRLGESVVRARADEPDGAACAVQTPAEVNGPEPRLRDPGATPARWIRLV